MVIASCGDATGPNGSYIRADITGAAQDTFASGIRFSGDFSRAAFRTLDIYGHQRSPDGGIRSFHLLGLAHVSLPDGQGASLMELGPSSPEVTGFTAIYTRDGLRFAARRGFIRPTEVGDDVIAASFSLRMFLYCTGETVDRCLIPREPPEDAVWIEVEGEFRGDPFPG
ncbi:MAG: hypothetical protein R3314_04845 [Longimicrobiales bacterium]|nr:hypothetical protein [Longimicrobiales bacterium]